MQASTDGCHLLGTTDQLLTSNTVAKRLDLQSSHVYAHELLHAVQALLTFTFSGTVMKFCPLQKLMVMYLKYGSRQYPCKQLLTNFSE